MRIATPEEIDRTRTRTQAGAVATRTGTPAWRLGVADALDRGDVDRWAREYLRALGWPLALPGARVWRRSVPQWPLLRFGPDWHLMQALEEMETGSARAVHGVTVRLLPPDHHAQCVRAGERDVHLFTRELVDHG